VHIIHSFPPPGAADVCCDVGLPVAGDGVGFGLLTDFITNNVTHEMISRVHFRTITRIVEIRLPDPGAIEDNRIMFCLAVISVVLAYRAATCRGVYLQLNFYFQFITCTHAAKKCCY